MDVTDRRQQPGLAPPSQFLRDPKGHPTDEMLVRPAEKEPLGDPRMVTPPAPAAKVSTDATTPSTTTPTASTDPRRAAFKKTYRKPPEDLNNAGP
jgi:hypothetical protein